MKPCQALVTTVLVVNLVGEAFGYGFPGIFSSMTSAKKVEGSSAKQSNSTKADELVEYQDNRQSASTPKPTRPPLFGFIPHPADHPLHPSNNPNHPLHPDNLPTLPPLPHFPSLPPLPHLPTLPPLPHLPSLPPLPSLPHPHFTRETIHATKTVFVEVTDRITVNPVCMTVHRVTPPCLPYNPYLLAEHLTLNLKEQDSKVPVIIPTAVAELIQPTGVVELLEPTRILGGETISEASPAPVEPVVVEPAQPAKETAAENAAKPAAEPAAENVAEPAAETPAETAAEPAAEGARNARYMEITPSISFPDEVEIKDEPTETGGLTPINVVQGLLHHSPVTHYKTKTLWVTKVEKVLDTRVTATLVAKNCIPTHSNIPFCSPHGGVFGTGYHGHHGEGTFHETIAGHFVAGTFTEKGEGFPDNVVYGESDEKQSDEKESARTEETGKAEVHDTESKETSPDE